MKRTLALNFVFVLCFSLYVGCGDTEDANSVTNSNADSESIFSTEDVKFTEDNGESRYSIVRPKDDAEDDPVWQNPTTSRLTTFIFISWTKRTTRLFIGKNN